MPDLERPLTRRGIADATEMARRLRARDEPAPQLLLTSPALRTQHTAGIIARELGLAARAVKVVDTLYLAPAGQLLAAARGAPARIGHLLLVGHNPGLSEFARQLAPGSALGSLAPGECCSLTFDADDWQSLGRAREVQCEQAAGQTADSQ